MEGRLKRGLENEVDKDATTMRKKPCTSVLPFINSYYAMQSALSIDHILEQILASMLKLNDLLNCRHVCHRWKFFSTFRLQKLVTIQITNFILNRGGKTSKNLTCLLKTSSVFPCINFTFNNYSKIVCKKFLNDDCLKSFLSVYGVYIKHLNFEFFNEHLMHPNESQVMDGIYTLLINQTPNLNSLTLDFGASFRNIARRNITRQSSFSKFQIDTNSQDKGEKNLNFKILKLPKGATEDLLQLFFHIAPNLTEVTVDSSYYNYFLEPISRLHLLKYFSFNPNSLDAVQLYECIALVCQSGSMRISQLRFGLQCVFVTKLLHSDGSQIETRAVVALNSILSSNWKSLEAIYWSEPEFYNGLRFPAVMPSLKKICFYNLIKLTCTPQPIFPEGFCWSKTFPRLSYFYIHWQGERNIFAKFVANLNLNPMESVREVKLRLRKKIVGLNHVSLLQKSFPNAKITDISVPTVLSKFWSPHDLNFWF